MNKKLRQKDDPIERAMESALMPGQFIRYSASYSFVNELSTVAASIAAIRQNDPVRATLLYETFLAGCYEKADEVDDSGGSLGQFAAGLFCGWIQARQASGADPGETAARLLAWMDNDNYGFCYQLEQDAAKVFDKAGLAAIEQQVRMRFDTVTQAGDSERDRRLLGNMLRTLYRAQKNVPAYVVLAEQTGFAKRDCHTVATILVARRKPEDALAWVERGMKMTDKPPHDSVLADHELAALKRTLLMKLGRANEALEAAWAAYCDYPNTYLYDDLMKFVPKPERSIWHEKAIKAAAGANLRDAIALFIDTREWERLAVLIAASGDDALEGLSHFTTEPAAKLP